MATTVIRIMSKHKFCILLINSTRLSKFRITLKSAVTKDKSYIFVQIAQEGFCLIEKCDGTLAPDVSGRECLHLPRQEQFPMFQLVTLLPI